MKHLKPHELAAFLDGRLESSRSLEHLASCEKCRGGMEDLRWLRTLLGKGKGTAVEEHPGRDEIAAFHDGALSPDDVTRIEEHLRSCDLCMAIYSGLRRKSADSPAGLPGPALYRKVKHRFRQTPGPWSLGVLVVQVVRNLSVHFIPAPMKPLLAAESVFLEFHAARSMLDVKLARAGRRLSSIDDLVSEVTGAHESMEKVIHHTLLKESSQIEPESIEGPPPAPRKPSPPHPSPPVQIEAGSWHLEISVAGSDKEPRLRITVRDRNRQRPAPGILFEMVRAETVLSRARTDDDGRLDLAVPSEDCHLHVGEAPPWIIRLVTVS